MSELAEANRSQILTIVGSVDLVSDETYEPHNPNALKVRDQMKQVNSVLNILKTQQLGRTIVASDFNLRNHRVLEMDLSNPAEVQFLVNVGGILEYLSNQPISFDRVNKFLDFLYGNPDE